MVAANCRKSASKLQLVYMRMNANLCYSHYTWIIGNLSFERRLGLDDRIKEVKTILNNYKIQRM